MSIYFGEGGATQTYAGVASAGQYWQTLVEMLILGIKILKVILFK